MCFSGYQGGRGAGQIPSHENSLILFSLSIFKNRLGRINFTVLLIKIIREKGNLAN